MKGLAALTALALIAALALAGGGAGFGRVTLALGLPRLAVPLLADSGWRGVAQYRAGQMDEAVASFAAARDYYNLGNAEAARGRYAAALEAYDLAIAQGVPGARDNFDRVAAFYAGLQLDPEALALFNKREDGPTAEAPLGEGKGRASGTGDETTNSNTMLGLAELDSRGRLGVRRIFDDAFMAADTRWLSQLPDVPGAYLKARISMEHKRRDKLGLSPPDPEDPQ